MHSFIQIYFNYRHNLEFPCVKLEKGLLSRVEQISSNEIFELSCTIDEIGENSTPEFQLTFDFDARRFRRQTIESFSKDFLFELKQLHLVSTTSKNLNSIESFETTQKDNVKKETLIECFYAQCNQTPENEALIFDKDRSSISYSNLKCLVMLNSELIRKKFMEVSGRTISNGDVIPILMHSNEAVIWILSVLGAGGAYCIIDVDVPERCLRYERK